MFRTRRARIEVIAHNNESWVDLADEAGGFQPAFTPINAAASGGAQEQPLAGPRHTDVAEPALLLDATVSERCRMGE